MIAFEMRNGDLYFKDNDLIVIKAYKRDLWFKNWNRNTLAWLYRSVKVTGTRRFDDYIYVWKSFFL